MLRLLRKAVPMGMVLVLATFASADALPTATITIQNYAFNPQSASAPIGTTAKWLNKDHVGHTSTSDTTNPDGSVGIGLWSSPVLQYNKQFSFTFRASGTYPYHCTPHPFMTGTASVPPSAPASGTVGQPITITLANTDPPPNSFVFDVQKKDPGGTFKDWMTGVAAKSVVFTATATGTYQFQARLRRLSTNGASYYSPSISIAIS